MLKISQMHLTAAKNATNAADLQKLLQSAIELEHSTIPPYLVAAYSLKPGTNTPAKGLIAGIAKEEMLHVSIVANVLNAIGGRPHIDDPQFIPVYPGPLPMSIGGLQVGLKKFSKALVHDVFMEIEEPEHPIKFPTAFLAGPIATIGAFYRAIIDKINDLGDGIFTGDPARQVVNGAGFPPQQLFAITNAATAMQALQQVVSDGEGTTTSPLNQAGRLAHYYRFEEIYHGRQLVPDSTVKKGYSYTGPVIPFEPADVFDIPDNVHAADYAAGSAERAAVDAFNLAYSDMLRLLQRAFDGSPGTITAAIQSMRDLRTAAGDVVSTTDSHTGKQLGPSFEYMPPGP